MTTWSFYDPATGLFVGRTYTGELQLLSAHTPDGCVAIQGEYDHECQRVENGLVVACRPPQPDGPHIWSGERWVKVPGAA